MKRLWLVIGIVLLALACSLTDNGGAEVTAVVEPEEPATQGGVEITVENYTPEDICYVQISPSGDQSWGDDRLDSNEVIGVDDWRSFSFPAGTYDVRVLNCDEAVLASAWEVSQDRILSVGQGGEAFLKIENQSAYEICYVYISSSREGSWGEDQLGSGEAIQPQHARIFYVEPGTYDLLVTDCEEQELAQENEVLLEAGEIVWTISD